jgi:hypothetical protein
MKWYCFFCGLQIPALADKARSGGLILSVAGLQIRQSISGTAGDIRDSGKHPQQKIAYPKQPGGGHIRNSGGYSGMGILLIISKILLIR